MAAVLHDVGKVGIPEAILNKPGRLDDGEFGVIKTHPGQGERILAPMEEFGVLVPGIKHHHERYGGFGYPDGLEGDEIPLVARIIAVADTYDAMTSDRAYRKALDSSEAVRRIRAAASTRFDPAWTCSTASCPRGTAETPRRSRPGGGCTCGTRNSPRTTPY
jgi:HD-GYP domain-containing protein (c-di-GMP phosphodiesterase class II)